MASLSTGCAGADYVPTRDALSIQANQSAAALGPGDTVNVRVYREKDLSGIFKVSPAGTIDFPLLGSIRAQGLTASQLAETIRSGLAQGYLRDPYVTVNVSELLSKRVYVLGQVAKPGTFVFTEGMTIIHAVTLAGGFTKIARPNSVVVTRNVEGKDVRMVVPVEDISEGKATNLHLLPGDIVFVPESIL